MCAGYFRNFILYEYLMANHQQVSRHESSRF